MPHASEQLSPYPRTTEPMYLQPVLRNEKPAQGEARTHNKEQPWLTQLERAQEPQQKPKQPKHQNKRKVC